MISLSFFIFHKIKIVQYINVEIIQLFSFFSFGFHPSPVTRHPLPVTRHPSPVTRHPSPVTRHPLPVTRHPSPVTRHPRKSPAAIMNKLFSWQGTACHGFNSSLGIVIVQSIVYHTPIKRRARYNILSATQCDKKTNDLNLKRDKRHRSNRPGFQLSHISLILARVILTEIQRRLKSRLLRQK